MPQLARASLLLALAALVAGCASTGLTERAARAQQNAAVVLAFLDTAYNRRDIDQAFKRYVAPNLLEHGAWAPTATETARAALAHRLAAPGAPARIEVGHSIAQGDLVAVQSRLLPAGESQPKEGQKGAGYASFDLFRLSHGLIVEHWSVSELQAAPAR